MYFSPGVGETMPLLAEKRPAHRTRTPVIPLLALLAATVTFVHVFHHDPTGRSVHRQPDAGDKLPSWSWDRVTPSTKLTWEKCYDDEFECARLDVPMDWQNATDKQRVVLGVLKLPAKSPENLPPVFLNPGGPGGSGINFLHHTGKELQTIVGENQDLISFDPRGVGVSTPRVECWGTAQKRKLWTLQETPVIDERPGLIYDAYARAVAESVACERALNRTGILEHISTPYHARDMLEILSQTGHQKLRYWGFSYGTILGGVFAGLYPERVERLVSDGNCDYEDWFRTEHTAHVTDTDLIFGAFDTACHKVGSSKCAFWASSPSTIQQRRDSLLSTLKKSPVIIPAWTNDDGPELPEVVTYSKLQRLVRIALYKPLVFFPPLADVFAALERGDGMPYYRMAQGLTSEGNAASQFCSLEDTPATQPLETTMETGAFPAIMCSDGEARHDTADDLAVYADKMAELSRWAGVVNVNFRSVCAGRTIRPKWRFSQDDFTKGDTAFPILFIGNLADNVTPFESARNNSARFPSSVVLKENSYGHCSLTSPSKCTVDIVRRYFQNGTLPEPGTECDPDYDLFELPRAEDDVFLKDELSKTLLDLSHKVNFGSINHIG